jgi:hypothetical protein
MASRYRFSLEIDDIRDRIENLYATVWWREMSLAAKIRTLVIERIEQLEQESRSNPNPTKTQKDG